jgi:hypothetical protein
MQRGAAEAQLDEFSRRADNKFLPAPGDKVSDQ